MHSTLHLLWKILCEPFLRSLCLRQFTQAHKELPSVDLVILQEENDARVTLSFLLSLTAGRLLISALACTLIIGGSAQPLSELSPSLLPGLVKPRTQSADMPVVAPST